MGGELFFFDISVGGYHKILRSGILHSSINSYIILISSKYYWSYGYIIVIIRFLFLSPLASRGEGPSIFRSLIQQAEEFIYRPSFCDRRTWGRRKNETNEKNSGPSAVLLTIIILGSYTKVNYSSRSITLFPYLGNGKDCGGFFLKK